MTDASKELEALKELFKFYTPWKKDKFSRNVAKYLDGDDEVFPTGSTERLDNVIQNIKDNVNKST